MGQCKYRSEKIYCKRRFPSMHYMCTVSGVFCKDIVFDKDTPCISKHEFAFVRGGVVDERETEMMKVRWRIFHLSRQIRKQDQKVVPPWGKCIARLVLSETAGKQLPLLLEVYISRLICRC